MRVVLFLGAGFSRGFGLPVMNEFFPYTKKHGEVTDAERSIVNDLLSGARGVQGTLSGSERNLEHVLSVAWAKSSQDRAQSLQAISTLIGKIYRRPKDVPPPETIARPFCNILGINTDESEAYRRWFSEHQLDIITTNYDLLGELATYIIGCPAALPFKWDSVEDTAERRSSLYSRSSSPTTIYKLHGSLNWFDNNTDVPCIEDRVTRIITRLGHERETQPWPAIGAADYVPRSTPLLVPPTFFKHHLHQQLEPVWTTAHQALQNADRLVFIGYSFPASDVQMPYFIGSALSENVRLDTIEIIDPHATEIAARISGSDSVFGRAVTEKLDPQDSDWQTARFNG